MPTSEVLQGDQIVCASAVLLELGQNEGIYLKLAVRPHSSLLASKQNSHILAAAQCRPSILMPGITSCLVSHRAWEGGGGGGGEKGYKCICSTSPF